MRLRACSFCDLPRFDSAAALAAFALAARSCAQDQISFGEGWFNLARNGFSLVSTAAMLRHEAAGAAAVEHRNAHELTHGGYAEDAHLAGLP